MTGLPKPTSAKLRQMRRECLQYPVELADIPADQWPRQDSGDSVRIAVKRNRKFLVQVYSQGAFTRLSINRTEWDERTNRFREDISWDDLQQLKREAGYGDWCAVELFPPDADVVNVANMRHLFLTPCPIFMWRDK